MSIRGKIQYTFIGVTVGLTLLLSVFSIIFIRKRLVATLGDNLTRSASTVAPFLDGDLHQLVPSDEDGSGEAFQNLRAVLAKARDGQGLPAEQIYTIRPLAGDSERMEFVVMTHPRSFVGDTLARNAVMNEVLRTGRPAATKIYTTNKGQWISAFAPIRGSGGDIVGLLEVDASYLEFQQTFMRTAAPIFIGVVALPIILTIVAILLAARISAPLRVIRDRMQELRAGEGDLTRRLNLTGSDEIAATADHIDTFNASIARIIAGTKFFAQEVADDSRALRGIADSLQETSSEETALIETTSAANEELAASFHEIERVTREQKQLVSEVVPNIDRLLQFIGQVQNNARSVNSGLVEVSDQIQNGRAEVAAMVGAIEEIARSSEQIESIVAIIVDISDRIALLSLNASIEAARAGEYGRGFAVVAEEVARLSDSTARQIKDITEIIERNRRETRAVVERTRRTEEVYGGLVRFVESSLEGSRRNIAAAEEQRVPAEQGRARLEEMTRMFDGIAGSVSEQSRASGEVASSMSALTEMAESVGQLTQKVYERSRDLDVQAKALDEMLSSLKTDQ